MTATYALKWYSGLKDVKHTIIRQRKKIYHELAMFDTVIFTYDISNSTKHCVVFTAFVNGRRHLIDGWYCAPINKPLSESLVQKMISTIGVKGRHEPAKVSYPPIAEQEETSTRAEQGDARAQYTLGHSYQFGIRVQKDIVEARRWYARAAEKGYPDAQYMIGLFYEKGRTVGKDLDKALNWYRKAAAQANHRAQYKIGLFYEQGWAVPKDLDEALNWYRKAAAQGDALAGMALDRLLTAALGATAPPIPPEGPSRPVKLIKCRLPDGFLISMTPERCLSVGGEPAQEGDIEERLTKLKELFDKGLITKDQYDIKRHDILEAL